MENGFEKFKILLYKFSLCDDMWIRHKQETKHNNIWKHSSSPLPQKRRQSVKLFAKYVISAKRLSTEKMSANDIEWWLLGLDSRKQHSNGSSE